MATTRFRALYGAGLFHFLALLGCFAFVGYVVYVLGFESLLAGVWWQTIIVWFFGAVIAHDLVLFPLYTLADRTYAAVTKSVPQRRQRSAPTVSSLNYVRVPALASALTLLLFLPGIIEQGADSYLAATGQTQDPFLGRWLLLTAAVFAISAVAYLLRRARTPTRNAIRQDAK